MQSEDIDALWDYSDPASSEAKFRQLLDRTEDVSTRAEIGTQIARTLGLQRRFEEALALLDNVPESTALLRARRNLEMGRVLNSSGKPQEALPLFLAAFEAAQSDPELTFYAVDAAHMLGIVCSGEEGLDWNRRAIDLARNASDERTRNWMASLLNNTAWTLHDLRRHQEAHDLFAEALELRKKRGQAESIRIAKWSVARALRSLGRLDEALQIQSALLAEGDDGFVLEEMGEILLAQGEADRARPFFARALELLSADPWLTAHEPERLARMKTLGSE